MPVQSISTPIRNGALHSTRHTRRDDTATSASSGARQREPQAPRRIARHPDPLGRCRQLAQARCRRRCARRRGPWRDRCARPGRRAALATQTLPAPTATPSVPRPVAIRCTIRPLAGSTLTSTSWMASVIQTAPAPAAILCGAIGSGNVREQSPAARRDLEEAMVERIADRPDGALADRQSEQRDAHVLGAWRIRQRDHGLVKIFSLAARC